MRSRAPSPDELQTAQLTVSRKIAAMARARRRAIFRADALSGIGGGHVMRCLTLARRLVASGWAVGFACAAETLTVVPSLAADMEVLEAIDGQSLDAAALARRWPNGCDVLVVDHYSLDARFETSCRGWAANVVAIDDLADRPHDCDVLIDATPTRDILEYSDLTPANALVLTGAEYALLRPEFAAVRREALARRNGVANVRRILVSLGLTDLNGVSEQAARVLLAMNANFMIDVVIGAGAPSKAALEQLAAQDSRLCVHVDPTNMAILMASADLAIGGGGTTSWERCCLGLPTVIMVLADNQRLPSTRLQEAGAALLASDTSGHRISDIVGRLANDSQSLRRMAAAAALLVDGRGSERVCLAISGLLVGPNESEKRLNIRLATINDSRQIWTWRNDSESRAGSRSSDFISWTDHANWFRRRLADSRSFILIGVIRNEPIGVVRFDYSADAEFEVSINLAPDKRSTGLGTRLLAAACAVFNDQRPSASLIAYIKKENLRSRRLFETCQFDLVATASDLLSYRRPAPS